MKERTAIGTAIQAALVSTLNVPEADRYQLFSEFDDDKFKHSGAFLGLEYTGQLLMVEITFLEGRDDELKKAFLAQMNKNLVDAGLVRPEELFVMITEAGLANVSFGRGLPQRAAE